MKPRTIFAAVAVAIGAISCGGGGDTIDEQTVVMSSGSYRTVGNGRAEILVGEVGDQWHDELGLLVDAVEVEVTCGEEKTVVWASEDQLTDHVCRVRLELVEIVTWSPPKVELRVTWEK